MKIILEPQNSEETEVIIKGNINSPDVEALLNFMKSKSSSSRLILFKEDEQFLVDAQEVVYLEACDGRISAVTVNGTFYAKQKLYEIKEILSALSFAQISKGVIVNIDFVKSVQAEFSGNYTLRLKDRKEILTISRKYFKEFKSKI
ncbi:MAG: LytTR family transcriptional regulator [Clostridia bacterium]|nr:LytTR family transcriptional regulator [Clostridia bacterium]